MAGAAAAAAAAAGLITHTYMRHTMIERERE